jgi:DNA-binding Lrp family transcriptional regulator
VRNPYITGAYVTGSNHYGRGDLLDYLLRSEGRAYWVIGTRRIGKTSLLRQLELLAAAGDRYVPLFWDVQGCASFTCMGGYLGDAVRDHMERFEPLGVTDAMLDQEDPLALLSSLRRLVRRAGRELLLLGDETEALIGAARDEPEAMQRFHRQLTGGAGLRVIFASTRQIYRMHDVCREWTTSPFLSGFDMSQTLGSLEPEAAEALILQTQAPEDSQVHAAAEIFEAITRATNDHPFLLQILCSRLFDENGGLRLPSDEDVRVDPILAGFFEHDFRQLSQTDRRIVLAVHRAGPTAQAELAAIDGDNAAELAQRLRNLEALGYLRRSAAAADESITIGNLFLASWLDAAADFLVELPASQTSENAMRVAFLRQSNESTASLVTQLNARRARLVELEAVRAREFTAVSPEVLEEMAQLQAEIVAQRGLLAQRR